VSWKSKIAKQKKEEERDKSIKEFTKKYDLVHCLLSENSTRISLVKHRIQKFKTKEKVALKLIST
jgi:hypothetical protein